MASQTVSKDDDFERAYFARRAVQETELAQRAGHRAAVAAHYRLATTYLDLAYADTECAPGPCRDGIVEPNVSDRPTPVAERRASDRRRTS